MELVNSSNYCPSPYQESPSLLLELGCNLFSSAVPTYSSGSERLTAFSCWCLLPLNEGPCKSLPTPLSGCRHLPWYEAVFIMVTFSQLILMGLGERRDLPCPALSLQASGPRLLDRTKFSSQTLYTTRTTSSLPVSSRSLYPKWDLSTCKEPV